MFVFFQFEAESRRRMKRVEARMSELELQLQSMARAFSKQDPSTEIAEIGKQQEFLHGEFVTHRKRVTELLELLIKNDEDLKKALPAKNTAAVKPPLETSLETPAP